MKHHLVVAQDNALERFSKFTDYMNKELDILESISYQESGIFLDQLPERAKAFILGANKDKTYDKGMDDFPQDVKDDLLVERVLYLSRVVDHLKAKSKESKYNPVQGSFWESIGHTLEKISSEVREEL